MTQDELLDLVAQIRQRRIELAEVEVKSAAGGTPLRAAREAMSAFANRPGGGVIVFGIDEQQGFALVGVGDPQRLQEQLAGVAANEMEPPLRPEFTLVEIDGSVVVAMEIAEIPVFQKPCHYRPAGVQSGSFIRVGTSNRQMTDYEVFGYVSAREQMSFDDEPIEDATLADLDGVRIEAYLDRLRRDRGSLSYLAGPQATVLAQLRILRRESGELRPTLAGLLVFGRYPQALLPQLVITFLQFFGTSEDERAPSGARFLDNRKFEGALPEMVEAAINHVLSRIRRSSLIEGVFRRDIPEYPVEALREAIVNAVAHRDYSPYVQGSHVQIRLFADRLEIQSPGGLYGNVTEETLEDEQSTRNGLLVRLLEDVRLVENRGSGIRAMIQAMREANLEPPQFRDRRTSFMVTFRNHSLMSSEAISWLNQFAELPLNDQQRLALVYLRHQPRITNADYRRLNHVDTPTALRDLRILVQAGLLEVQGSGRWSFYAPVAERFSAPPEPLSDEDRVLAYVRKHGSITNALVRELLDIPFQRASDLLTRMFENGLLHRSGTGRWTVYRLPPIRSPMSDL